MVQLAAEWAANGQTIDVIETRIKEMIHRCRVYFLVATLEYLAKGGRIGGAYALLGSVLQIKPILTINDGKVEVYERERTHKRALNRIKEIVLEQFPRTKEGYLAIMHAAVPEQGKELAIELSSILGINSTRVPILDVPPAIVTHGGPGILGVSFFVGK